MTHLTHRFDEALLYARAVHQDQTRKGTSVPYLAHLLSVAALAIEAGANEDQAIAALLHDAVEDQGGQPRLADIRARFGDAVAEIVQDCSDTDIQPKPPWRTRKEAYLKLLERKAAGSLLVSLADKIHNAEAILADLRTIGDAVWERFNGRREGTLWYYASLAEAFERLLPGPASARLSHAVAAMQCQGGADPGRVVNLLEYCRTAGRICPAGLRWKELWELLPNREPLPTGGWSPPLPLILAAWHIASDTEKARRLAEHIIWGANNGALAVVDEFLRGLSDADWHRRCDH